MGIKGMYCFGGQHNCCSIHKGKHVGSWHDTYSSHYAWRNQMGR